MLAAEAIPADVLIASRAPEILGKNPTFPDEMDATIVQTALFLDHMIWGYPIIILTVPGMATDKYILCLEQIFDYCLHDPTVSAKLCY